MAALLERVANMKYQSTSRVLSFLFHTIIFLAFGALGMYFGAFVVPQFFTSGVMEWRESLFDAPYFLYLEFAVIGFTYFVLSGYGAYQAWLGLSHPNDDAPVVKSLTVFIVEGWIISLALLLHGVLLFDVTANGTNMAFAVVMALIFAILMLIATNIPMVKLYDAKDQKQLIGFLLMGAVVFTGFMIIEVGLGLVLTINETYSAKMPTVYMLLTLLCQNVIAFVLSLLAAIAIKKGKSSLAGYLTSGASFGLGAGLVIYGALDMVYYDKPVHFNLIGSPIQGFVTEQTKFGYGFPIMCIVVGAAMLAAACYLIWNASREKKIITK